MELQIGDSWEQCQQLSSFAYDQQYLFEWVISKDILEDKANQGHTCMSKDSEARWRTHSTLQRESALLKVWEVNSDLVARNANVYFQYGIMSNHRRKQLCRATRSERKQEFKKE